MRAAYAEAVTESLDNSGGEGEATSQPMKSESWDKLKNLDKIGNLPIGDIDKTKGKGVTISVDSEGTVSAAVAN